MTDPLPLIHSTWLSWAKKEIEETEFAARIAEALEGAGYPVIADEAP